MARETNYKYSTYYGCNVSESGMSVYHNLDIDDSELPLPIDCPLRTEPITITLNTPEK